METSVEDREYLDRYGKLLEEGLVKICRGAGILGPEMPSSLDIDGKWNDYVKGYIGDAVQNFNDYPEAAIAWAAFLGMGVANRWDQDWANHSRDSYSSYYGPRGWDDMDEYILGKVLCLKEEYAKKVSDVMDSCALATLGLIRHEQVEPQTSLGFFVLSRSYEVMYHLGAAVELHRLGYRRVAVNPKDLKL